MKASGYVRVSADDLQNSVQAQIDRTRERSKCSGLILNLCKEPNEPTPTNAKIRSTYIAFALTRTASGCRPYSDGIADTPPGRSVTIATPARTT